MSDLALLNQDIKVTFNCKKVYLRYKNSAKIEHHRRLHCVYFEPWQYFCNPHSLYLAAHGSEAFPTPALFSADTLNS